MLRSYFVWIELVLVLGVLAVIAGVNVFLYWRSRKARVGTVGASAGQIFRYRFTNSAEAHRSTGTSQVDAVFYESGTTVRLDVCARRVES